jgi:predicted phage terminase large subunit-like protein
VSLTPQQKRQAAIQASKADFYFFSRWMFLQRKQYKWLRGAHHEKICAALHRVFTGECTRLIINVAPRYSKTELAVVNFIAWTLGLVPDAEFIHASYSGRLAGNNSWNARELVTHPAYQEIFPATRLRDDSAAKDEWKTTAGGIVYAAGTGGTITGYGAGKERPGFGGAIIIDDPHKADEARSDTIRAGVIDWFQNTLESRKNSKNTPIILIMQRLHEADLAGWLLDGGNGEKWEHLCIKTLQDDGTALWPEKHDAALLRSMQEASPYNFASQYQQSPAPPEGNIFKPDKIEIVEAIPAGTRMVRGWDLAGTRDDGDWTAGPQLGVTPSGRYIIADMVRLQGSPDEVEAAIVNAAKRDGANCRIKLPQDPGQAGKSQVAYLTKQLAGFSVTSAPVSGDKITRAEPFAAQVNVGNVMMLKAEWNDKLIGELRMFPNGKNDDQVDGLSDAFSLHNESTFGLLDYYQKLAEQHAERQRNQNTN